MKNANRLFTVLLFWLFVPLIAHSQECPGAHCSAKSEQINNICKAQGQAGNLVFVEHPAGSGQYCYCRCSCLPPDTPVAVAPEKWQELGKLKVGDSVLALQQDGTWKMAPVVFSDGTKQPKKPLPYAIYVTTSNGTSLVTTADHAFLLADMKTLRRADRLQPNDQLVNADTMKPVSITRLYSGSYLGPMHNIAATSWNTTDDQWGHLINTRGVVSADYFAQVNLVRDDAQTEPQVGSDEYLKRHSSFRALQAAPKEIKLGKAAKFIPHKRLAIPPDAIPFLEPGQDVAAKGTLHPLDYTLPYEMAQYLTNHYQRFYPQIVFHVEWQDDRVNAFAWMQGSTRHVAILGGLLRHRAIRQEGAGLVLSHETGHHFGGNPRYPSGNTWASCEGQSDYWGASVAQRTVWWGSEALEKTMKGAEQLYDLFANGLLKGNLIEQSKSTQGAVPFGICSHPPAYCRHETYLAANRLEPKPSCAGDPPSLLQRK